MAIVCAGKIEVRDRRGQPLDTFEVGRMYSDSCVSPLRPLADFIAVGEVNCICLVWADYVSFLSV